ncbi:SH3 domain-containing protein [Pseudomonas sp. RC4D1]|uniref:SH3 domain-containing protein n=1 Tax=Pseudomonas sp. RC4D1 TaxID=2834407 RepID=UPI001BCE5054|nr:SH3 domain-containing protein [Pseudomonas sp. RC4D1]MBS7559372.1 SH3 domain-containing protein [Pseudomonas sp. RC4D1]
MAQANDSGGTVLDQRKAMWEDGELQRQLIRQLIAPDVVKKLNSVFQVLDLTFKAVLKPEVVAGFQTVLRNIETVAGSPQFQKILGEFGRTTEGVLRSPLLEYLVSGRGPDLGELIDGGGVATVSISLSGDARVVTEAELDLEQQIVGRLESGETVDSFSKAQKFHFHAVINVLKMIVLYLAAMNGVREDLCSIQPKLLPTMTSNQVARAVRAAVCDVPVEFLSGYRSVKGEGVRLRTEPNMKSPLVNVNLADRALLEVLDSSNRDWLYVSVVGDEGVEGWISRKYTHPIMR